MCELIFFVVGHRRTFPIQTCEFLFKVKAIELLRGGVACYAAQEMALIDAEIGQKGHLWVETKYVQVLAIEPNREPRANRGRARRCNPAFF